MNQPRPTRPAAPIITFKTMRHQLKADLYDKETQSAATYSYLWIADQMGHFGLALLLYLGISVIAGFAGTWVPVLAAHFQLVGMGVTVIGVCLYELSTCRAAVKKAGKRFPLDSAMLRWNAVTAAGYMALGALVGYALGPSLGRDVIVVGGALAVALVVAHPWYRQKIVWQKAAMPYLSRLADFGDTIQPADAQALQQFVIRNGPNPWTPRQVIIAGPIGSGRTSLAAGVGTEYAFTNRKVAFLSLDTLLEFAATAERLPPPPFDPGPVNIQYWPWFEAELVVIDDISPVITQSDGQSDFERFASLLANQLTPLRQELQQRDTLWVLGNVSPLKTIDGQSVLDRFAQAIGGFCNGPADPLIIRLSGRIPRR